jgi:ribosome biogenesis GTPase / thiamine phosphate phosphatase
MTAELPDGPIRLQLSPQASTADHAVGDWVLVDPASHLLIRRLDRRTLLQRRTEGGRVPQLIAANVDTLLIVTSCNDDLNPARLERYLALANEAGTTPVIVLTKADMVPDTAPFVARVAGLQRGLDVVSLNAHSARGRRCVGPLDRPGSDRGAGRVIRGRQIVAPEHPGRQGPG